jgi:hypothetical protein
MGTRLWLTRAGSESRLSRSSSGSMGGCPRRSGYAGIPGRPCSVGHGSPTCSWKLAIFSQRRALRPGSGVVNVGQGAWRRSARAAEPGGPVLMGGMMRTRLWLARAESESRLSWSRADQWGVCPRWSGEAGIPGRPCSVGRLEARPAHGNWRFFPAPCSAAGGAVVNVGQGAWRRSARAAEPGGLVLMRGRMGAHLWLARAESESRLSRSSSGSLGGCPRRRGYAGIPGRPCSVGRGSPTC